MVKQPELLAVDLTPSRNKNTPGNGETGARSHIRSRVKSSFLVCARRVFVWNSSFGGYPMQS